MAKRNFILVLVLSICLWACKTANVATNEKKEIMRPAKIVENAMATTPTYEKASYKFSCEYSVNGGSPDSFSGNLRVYRDSLIWISLRSFNIEGFRILISQDSLKAINRLKNEYYAEDISMLEEIAKIDLSFNDLQSILLNEFFCYTSDNDTTKTHNAYKPCIDSIYYCISTISPKKLNRLSERPEKTNNNYLVRHGSIIQTIKIIPGTFKVKNMYLEDLEDGRSAYTEYDKFARYGEILFPQSMNIYIESNKFDATLKFTISDFTIEEELTFPFKISAKYTKIKLNENNR